MGCIELPYGNGQEIYVDPDILDIKPEWINEKEQAIFMPNYSLAENIIYTEYKKMFRYLYDMGYKIVTDSTTVSNDAFFFTPCLDKHVNKTREEYISKKKQKFNLCLIKEGIQEPQTITFPVDSFPDSIPPLPLVLKNKDSQGGMEKFLIKTPEQLQILKKIYNEITFYDRKVKEKNMMSQLMQFISFTDEEVTHKKIEEFLTKTSSAQLQVLRRCFGEIIPNDKKIELENMSDKLQNLKGSKNCNTPSIGFIDYKKEFHQNMVLQKYIVTPTKYNTSLRVLTSSSGDILCSSLKYSSPDKIQEEKHTGIFDRYLSEATSPYFLGSESIVSNTVAGGDSILLEKDNYTKLEQEILIAHGINPTNAQVPENVCAACVEIATSCSREVGAICGLDFIFDEDNKVWKYLEEHEYPMFYSYAEKFNLPYDSFSDEFYTINRLLDKDVRLHALALTMQKKYQKKREF